MAGQVEFLEMMRELERIGQTNGNHLSMREINQYFEGMRLQEEQMDYICRYLESKKIYIESRIKKQDALFEDEIETKADPLDQEMVELYIKEAKNAVVLSKEEQEVLAGRLLEGDLDVQNALIESNLALAVKLAKEYQKKGLLLSDLIQEGNIGLVLAVQSYGLEGQGAFDSFIETKIREHMEEKLAEYNASTRSAMKMASRINELNDLATAFAKEYEREAKPKELAERMGISEKEVKELMKVSLDAIAILNQ